jgi:hydrogenase maturation protein HypF
MMASLGHDRLLTSMELRRPSVAGRARLRVRLAGVVQGVGFRPYVFRLATQLGLAGWVRNDLIGVEVEVEGGCERLQGFLERLQEEAPAGTRLESCEAVWLDPVGYDGFTIRASEKAAAATAWIRPDSATCRECLHELFEPTDRRYRHPFINCTHCGPRYTILERLPYDRGNTSMKAFAMCARCAAEYANPASRRFHAQPNACPDCGPTLALWGADGHVLAVREGALAGAVAALREGRIVAVKGLGGYHLMTLASDAQAITQLRERKHREEKPLAVMFPAVDAVRALCDCSPAESRVLGSPEAPIVLLRRLGSRRARARWEVAANVAPGQSNLGVFLPYTALHHLLLHDLGEPVVATSGNRGDEPICITESEALERLGGVADLFLVHNRPIVRPVDDSVVRVVAQRELVLRRARGFAPLPVGAAGLEATSEGAVLAVGAHLKNAVALAVGSRAILSQHVGDLETVETFAAFRRTVQDLATLYSAPPVRVIHDAHPDYLSSRYARESDLPCETVQHHLAHIAAVMAENELEGPLLGIAWDGTGLGEDGTLWGGEFLRVDRWECRRVARLRPFPLPGGDQAAREPRRAALGLVAAGPGDWRMAWSGLPWRDVFRPQELEVLAGMLQRNVNCPLTSSIGRLFDAVASLIGLRQECRFEGQAAMELEAAVVDPSLESESAYPLPLETAPGSQS